MPKPTDQRVAPDFSKQLDIESIISAPLIAISKANAVMAQGQTRFLLEYCFNKTGDNYEPVLIQMSLTRSAIVPAVPAVAAIPAVEASAPGVVPVVAAAAAVPATPAIPASLKNYTTEFNLPLLTILPLNSLAVDKVTIEFDMEITSVTAKPTLAANQTTNKITDKNAQLYGKIANSPDKDTNDQNRSQLSNKLKMNINAGTLPLPAGVLTIIDLYTRSIQPLSVNDNPEK